MVNRFVVPLVLALSLLPACVTTRDGLQVVERSKKEAPQWTSLTPNQLIQVGAKVALVSIKGRILDLPLGIKQTQLGALSVSQNAIHELFLKDIFEAAKQAGFVPKSPKDLSQTVLRVVRKTHSTGAQIGDIYFEKLAEQVPTPGQPTQYYQVFILVQLSQEMLSLIHRDLQQALSSARDPELQRLGGLLKERPLPALPVVAD